MSNYGRTKFKTENGKVIYFWQIEILAFQMIQVESLFLKMKFRKCGIKAKVIKDEDASVYRNDYAGAWINRDEYGTRILPLDGR